MKKTFVKILSVFFCTLLIAALAVPCFADPFDFSKYAPEKETFYTKGSGTKISSVPSDYEGVHRYNKLLGDYDSDEANLYVCSIVDFLDYDDPLDLFNEVFESEYSSLIVLDDISGVRSSKCFDYVLDDTGAYARLSGSTATSYFVSNSNNVPDWFLRNIYFSPDLEKALLVLPYDCSIDFLFGRNNQGGVLPYCSDYLYETGCFVFGSPVQLSRSFWSLSDSMFTFRFYGTNFQFVFGSQNFNSVYDGYTFDTFFVKNIVDEYKSFYFTDRGLFSWIEGHFLPLFGEVPTDEVDMGILGTWSPLQLVRAALWVSLGGVCVSAFVVLPYVLILRLAGIKKRRKGK